MTVYFTADLHLGHAGIIRMTRRPFASVEEHDSALVALWNGRVGPKDEVHVLGDFAFRGSPERTRKLFASLRGRKHLVIGNHDGRDTLELPWDSPPVHYREVAAEGGGPKLVLSHYALRNAWNGWFRGSCALFGHHHGRMPANSRSLDVGVDCWNYAPVSWPEIKARMAASPEAVCDEVHEDENGAEPAGPAL